MRVDLDADDLKRILDWYGICEVEGQYQSYKDKELYKYLHTQKRLLEDEIRRGEHEI